MCQVALYVLLALLSQGIDAQPAGRCAVIATLSISAYTNNSGNGEGITASGLHTEHGIIAAGNSIPFGTGVLVIGYGAGRIQDRGNLIGDGNIDIWTAEYSDAISWGRREMAVVMWWGE